MLYCILGNSGAGKTDICTRVLAKNTDIKDMILCTTRPPRENERFATDYHYIDDKIFSVLSGAGLLYEERNYNTSEGVWRYGTLLADIENAQNNDYIVVASPSQFCEYYNTLKEYVIPIVLYADYDTRLQRKLSRGKGETEKEIRRRMDNDEEYFYIDKIPMEFVIPNYNSKRNLVVDAICGMIDIYKDTKKYSLNDTTLEQHMFEVKLDIMYRQLYQEICLK